MLIYYIINKDAFNNIDKDVNSFNLTICKGENVLDVIKGSDIGINTGNTDNQMKEICDKQKKYLWLKYFKEKNIPDELSNKYPDKKIIESYGNYYFLDTDGSVYQIISNYYDQKVKLFQLDDFKELKVLNNNVYGVSKDTVYIYNNKIGLKKAIVNRELIYNYKNIYDVYES